MSTFASRALSSHPRLRLTTLLTAPVLWLGLVYIVALAALLITALWTVNAYTGQVEMTWTLDNILAVATGSLYRTVTLRTLGIAILVTVIDVIIAVPIAFTMAQIASPRAKRYLTIAILAPLWASYLVKVYAWRSLLSSEGLIQWVLSPLGGQTPGYGIVGVVLALAYLWLPYVILPIQAGFERIPSRLLEASSDLGAHSWTTFRTVMLPLIWPSIVAGSVFSFCLSLGDYITVGIVGGSTQMLGNLVYTNVGSANNLPMAAAIALIPILIVFIYLAIVRRVGALDKI